MDLWVRSQDKIVLLPINKPLRIEEGKRFSICGDEDVFQITYSFDLENKIKWILGAYKLETRAIEVLNEIQNKMSLLLYLKPKGFQTQKHLETMKKYYEKLNQKECIICNSDFEIVPILSNIIVYEMPEE